MGISKEKMNLRHKCYQVDKRYWGRGKRYVYDTKQKKVVLETERTDEAPPPTTSTKGWDPEWSVLATGQRMSKRELKDYCKRNGKILE